MKRFVRALAQSCFLLVIAAPSAFALPEEECPTWFPDLNCDREARTKGFTRPMSMPYLFEDPFITTEAQAVGIWHDTPDHSVLGGGNIGIIALQLRLAITEDLAFIATKDGVTFLRPEAFEAGGPLQGVQVIDEDTDLMDLTFGFKYAAYKTENFILTPALRYEIPLGAKKLFQGQGNGVLIPSVSGAWGMDDFHVIGSFGMQVPMDGDEDSTSLFYNLHLDYAVTEHFSPFIEVNGMHWTNAGDGSQTVFTNVPGASRLPLSTAQALLGQGGFEGNDVANLGSGSVDGNDIVTMAWGARFPVNDNMSFGLSYERAISQRKDLFKQRVTAMVTLGF